KFLEKNSSFQNKRKNKILFFCLTPINVHFHSKRKKERKKKRKEKRRKKMSGIHSLFVDSSQRTSGTDTEFIVEFQRSLENKAFEHCCIEKASIPLTFYNISDELSTSAFTINDGSDDVEITLTEGSYSATELVSHMETALNASSSGFTVSFESITGKMTFERTSNFSLLLSTKENLARLLGFAQADFTGTNSYTSSDIVNMRLLRNFFLFIDQIHTDINHCYPAVGSDITAIWAIEGNLGDVQYITSNDRQSYKLRECAISTRLKVRLEIEEGTLNLNGHHFQFLIRLW
ncbi:MAG: hypothetical protein U9P79_06805, partial [Candidatus Cloacimonadota bacterium]|nr:hypothetical protein [Candidatus Cloacimonadota bacterium]